MTRRSVVIAICGAQGSGKSELVSALAEALRTSSLDFTLIKPFVENLNSNATSADLTLLCGLERPQGDLAGLLTPEVCVAEDTQLRAALISAGVSFQVIYGPGTARLKSALNAISAFKKIALRAEMTPPTASEVSASSKKWQWTCDKCSDPLCEHALFTGLVK